MSFISSGTQVEQFLARLPEPLRRPPHREPFEPQAVFRGALQLTSDQEERLVDHCLLRLDQLSTELGRDNVLSEEWWKAASGQTADTVESGIFRSHLGRRALWDMVYAGQMDWRRTVYGGLFVESNQHFPVCRRLTQQAVSRAQNFFFGTHPWLSISPIGKDDELRAKLVERLVRLGFERGRAIEVLNQGIELSFIRGEVLLKPTWKDRRSYYQDYLTVALGDDGEPLLAQDGEYIFEDDEWVDVSVEGRPMFLLARDQQTWLPEYAVEPDDLVFDQRLLDREEVEYQGLDLGILPKEDFLCPLNVPSVDEADMVIHLLDRPTIEVCSQYLEHVNRTGDAASLAQVMDFLRNATGQSEHPVGHKFSRRLELGEAVGDGSSRFSVDPERDWLPYDRSVIRTAECWAYYPVLDDGVLRKVMVTIDLDHRKAISYDWERRVVPPGCGRPFHVLRVNPVPGRWHGASPMELYYPLNHTIDVAANRVNHANQGSGTFRSIDISGLHGFDGGELPPTFSPSPGVVYTRKKGVAHDEIFGETPLVNYQQDRLMGMMEFTLQMANNLSGVATANDNEAAGLDSTKLATGILHLERQNQELFAPMLGHLTPGIEGLAKNSVMLMLEHAGDNADAQLYFDGDEQAMATLLEVNPRNFRFNLKVLLSRFKAYQQSIQISAGRNVIEHYAAADPNLRPAIRALVERELEIYEIPNASQFLDWIDQFQVPLIAQPGPPSAGQIATQSGNRTQPLE